MVSFRSSIAAATTVLSLLGSIQAIPLADKLSRLSPSARDVLKRSTPAAPRFVVYNDRWTNPFPSASELRGFNVFALTFLLASGSVDQAQNWQELTASQRATYVKEYNAAGISLIVAGFGSTETPTSSGVNPVTAANTMAEWVIQYGVNGIDVDYEDFTAFNGGGGAAESWLIRYTKQLRTRLPQGQYILSHAPVAPWFSPTMWSGGGYLAVHKSVGSLIDWYNVQFYNQGTSEYTTCSGLLTASTSAWPESALFQIAANGVTLEKLVIGKPATPPDASNGYMNPSTLASCVSQAASKGWGAGVMAWQYPDATSAWITTVCGNTWPGSHSPGPSPTTTQPASPTSTGPPGGGNCAGVSAWVNSAAYSSGSKVAYNGDLWTANQWNQYETPGGSSGAWTNDGACA
ncbi:glycoside hydrolase family 18 protein [Boletus edulis]|uniref:Glycoside hydrolase family 18 protein n=1 Tax=Boletus edulis BED1 TaxID=1328754 RepID=A0AAD4BMC4_BOLED|nr:glycoside hydrolase family 18 protein [Boletus edulis]KAF8129780.1 glycoside hydrolase family 18 protein [Boletus edulis]KAF8434280.1 glycoside hydrolase family 18 protein [Boletus edulis BED1]